LKFYHFKNFQLFYLGIDIFIFPTGLVGFDHPTHIEILLAEGGKS
jgi:hypothetical protein